MYKLYAFHLFLVDLKNFWKLHVRIMCANLVVIKQDTQVKYCQIHKIQKKAEKRKRKRIRTMKENKMLEGNWWKTMSKSWFCPCIAIMFLLSCFTICFLRFLSSISDAFLVISIIFKEIKKKQSKLRKSRVGYAGRNHFIEHMIFWDKRTSGTSGKRLNMFLCCAL